MAIDKSDVVRDAQKFADRGQFDKAIAQWKTLLKESPRDANIYNTIGDLYLKKDSKKESKAEAVEAYKKAADILASDGFTSKAIALYKKVINIDAKKIEVHLALADLNAEKGLTGNALESYKCVADLYAQQKEMKKALGIYQKMADLNSSNVAFRLKVADMYVKEGMKNEAVKAYLEAAEVHISKDAFNDARQIFEKALAVDPNSKEVYHKAGVIYLKEGKFAEACKALKPAFENDSSNNELAELYIDALSKAGRGAEAEDIFKKLLSQDPSSVDLRTKLYHLYLEQKDYDKALSAVSSLVNIKMGNEELDAAEEILKGFLGNAPRHIEGRRKLSDFYKTIGKGMEAARELLAAAEILIEGGEKESAKEILGTAIELAPDFAEARQKLEALQPPQVPPLAPEPAPAAKPDMTGQRIAHSEIDAPVGARSQTAEPRSAQYETDDPLIDRSEMTEQRIARSEIDDPLTARSDVAEPEIVEPDFAEPPASGAVASHAPSSAVGEVPPADNIPIPAAGTRENPAILEAFTEADVLVKYGLAIKAIEQLENLAQKFPGNFQIHTRLRDLYGDQGDMSRAAGHMVILADLYKKKGQQDQVEPILRAALGLDPDNREVRSRLGIAPPPSMKDRTASPSRSAKGPAFENPAEGAAALEEGFFGSEEDPANTRPDAGLQDSGEEPVSARHSRSHVPRFESLPQEHAAHGEIAFEETDAVSGSIQEGDFGSFEEDIPEVSHKREPEPAGEDRDESHLAGSEGEAPLHVPPARTEETADEKVDLSELWAEAEFYYQQGLFNEAKKHYARIIQHDPGNKRAIERLMEISREAEETHQLSKLAEAVDGLGTYVVVEEVEKEVAASPSDDAAVRSLMHEIAQLKQPADTPSSKSKPGTRSLKNEKVSPEKGKKERKEHRPEKELQKEHEDISLALDDIVAPARPNSPRPAGKDEKASFARPAAGQDKPRTEEDFFDIGIELQEEEKRFSAPEKKKKPAGKNEDFFDLASELREELSNISFPGGSTPPSVDDQSLDDIFEEFKKGVEQQAAKEDTDTHYNLGVAYKEMGLLDEAIAEFLLTPEDESKFVQSRYMLGLCYMEKSEYQTAITELKRVVNEPGQQTNERDIISFRYDLGLAYQGAGNTNNALSEFQKVYDADPGYRDVKNKIKELQQGDTISLEQLKEDIEREISSKFLEEGERIEREEKIRKSEKVRG